MDRPPSWMTGVVVPLRAAEADVRKVMNALERRLLAGPGQRKPMSEK